MHLPRPDLVQFFFTVTASPLQAVRPGSSAFAFVHIP